ncbi:MAG: Ig-like domain-containing protein [Chloroflexota bacterium]
MQKVVATALAIPILILVYAGTMVRRAGRRPALMALFAIGLTGVIVATAVRPAPASGTLPARQSALDPAEFTTVVETGESPSAPIVISFPAAMNTASVERLTRVDPATPVAFSWDATATLLTISPRPAWATATFHTVTVEAGALDATGRPLDQRIRSAFLTREAVTATISASGTSSGAATPTSQFLVTFSGPVDPSSIRLNIAPAVAGRLAPAPESPPEQPAFLFIPDQPLAAGVTFTVDLAEGARDADGGAITGASATIKTASAPTVVRFRPANGATSVGWSQNLSVRFTEPMDRVTTEKAWSAIQGGKAIAGTLTWAENDTVLVFNPSAVLGYGEKVVLTVDGGATSKVGLPLAATATASFTSAARPIVKTSTPSSGSTGSSGSGGGTIGSSTWSAVEAYYLTLMNCTRTGGLVTSSGSCSSPGGRNVAALWQDAGITSNVSRPYAKKLAVNNLCTHFSGGTPGDRLKAAGYTSYIWAENLGCRSGDPYASVLATHLFYQSEWSYNGGHYVNLMNPDYDRVGIGVWVSSGRVRLVVDFYRPR